MVRSLKQYFYSKFQQKKVFLSCLYNLTSTRLFIRSQKRVCLKNHLSYSAMAADKSSQLSQHDSHSLSNTITSPLLKDELTFPVAVECYLRLLIWHLFLSRGWTEFVVLFFGHFSSAHTEWPFPAPCRQRASPPLQNKKNKKKIANCKSNNGGDLNSVPINYTWSSSKVVLKLKGTMKSTPQTHPVSRTSPSSVCST